MDDGPNLVRLLAFNGGLLFVLVVVVGLLVRRTARIHNDAWRAFAEARGFSFTPSRGFWMTWQTARIDGEIRGVPITIDSYFQRAGRGAALHTRIRAGEKELRLDGFVMDASALERACEECLEAA
jgi:hypothetical protein